MRFCSVVESHTNAVRPADAVVKRAAEAAAAYLRNVGRRGIEGIVERAIDLDMIVPAIGAAEVAIDDRRDRIIAATVEVAVAPENLTKSRDLRG